MPGMDTSPQPPNPILLLPRDTCYQLVHTLRGMLPPPVTDTPEDLGRRDNAAIAQVACLMPVNADEANLAAEYVATNACAMDCLRLAQEHRGDAEFFLRFSARATIMMRQSRATRTLLLSVQAERRKLEADSVAADHAARTEQCVDGCVGRRPARGDGGTAAATTARSATACRGVRGRLDRGGGAVCRHLSATRRAHPYPGQPVWDRHGRTKRQARPRRRKRSSQQQRRVVSDHA